ncbi:hypothetical protein KIN20_001630 [Parelaphostrongylus tenuis]|uniref:Uncharacterized protein n=1 Tax=Parelaphostrongylus tenuis TaxID=148309 RepID=A0AAD5MCU2_PARTN|nr:hypothetical protein KIN20_001630 [Parelaphostrongylus tenuis]
MGERALYGPVSADKCIVFHAVISFIIDLSFDMLRACYAEDKLHTWVRRNDIHQKQIPDQVSNGVMGRLQPATDDSVEVYLKRLEPDKLQ